MRHLIVWVFWEIILSLTGLDDLADYSEFLDQEASTKTPIQITIEYGKIEVYRTGVLL